MAKTQTTTGVLGHATGLTTDGTLQNAGDVVLIDSVSPDTVGDDGGWIITATGLFPVGVDMVVRIQDGASINEACYSGVQGQGTTVQSADGTTLSFVSPPLPVGVYNLNVTADSLGLSFTAPSVLTLIKKTFTTVLFSLRRSQAYPRKPGPFDIQDEP